LLRRGGSALRRPSSRGRGAGRGRGRRPRRRRRPRAGPGRGRGVGAPQPGHLVVRRIRELRGARSSLHGPGPGGGVMRDRRPIDLVTKRVALPDAGLGRGWEGPALFGITLLLLSFGLVTLYSASV